MRILLVADDKLADVLEPPLVRAGHAVTRSATPTDATLAEPGFVVAPLKTAKALLERTPPGRLLVLLPPGRDAERDGLLAAGAAETFVSPVKASVIARRVAELAADRAAVDPAPTIDPPPAIESAPAFADDLFEDAHRWPKQLPSEEVARAELVQRAKTAAAEVGEVEATLGDVYRALSKGEIDALRAEAPTADDELFQLAAAHRLVVHRLAAEVPALGAQRPELDDAALAPVRAKAAELRDRLAALVDRAMKQDPTAFRRFEPVRSGLGRADRELENALRTLRGEALLDDATVLDRDHAPEAAPAPARPAKSAQVGQVTIHDAPPEETPPERRNLRALVALAAVAVVTLLVHVFVLHTFSRPAAPPLPKGRALAPVAGLPLVDVGGHVEARVDPTSDIADEAREAGEKLQRPVVVVTPDGHPVGVATPQGYFPAPDYLPSSTAPNR